MAQLTETQRLLSQAMLRLYPVGKIVDFKKAARGRVRVDGIERNYVSRCKIGPDGWIEQLVRTKDNRPILITKDGKRAIKTRIIKGTVAFTPSMLKLA